MTLKNAEIFQSIFHLYATEVWAKPEKEFLDWLNADYTEIIGGTESNSFIRRRGEIWYTRWPQVPLVQTVWVRVPSPPLLGHDLNEGDVSMYDKHNHHLAKVSLYGTDGNAKNTLFNDEGSLCFCFNPSQHESRVDFNDVVSLMPTIESVSYEYTKRPTIRVRFSDGTTESAVLANGDVFNFDTGIGVCLIKRVFSTITNGNGSALYNKLYKYGSVEYKRILKREEDKFNKSRESEKIKMRRFEKAQEKKAAKRKKSQQSKEDFNGYLDRLANAFRLMCDELKKFAH